MINNATLNVVGHNKGATPNRFLFIPGMPQAPPNCATLKPGDAWAGVGLYCKLGSATSILSGGAAATAPSTDLPVAVAATGPSGGVLSHDAAAPAQPASVPAADPSAQEYSHASTSPAQPLPAAAAVQDAAAREPAETPAGNTLQEAAVPPGVTVPGVAAAETDRTKDSPSRRDTAVMSAAVALDSDRSTTSEADASVWLIVGGVLSAAAAAIYSSRRLLHLMIRAATS